MSIVVAGGTGFLGAPLVSDLARDHDVIVLTRQRARSPGPRVQYVRWTPGESDRVVTDAIEGAEAVVNLAGESIAGRRWTAAHKRRILDSRVVATRSLASAIGRAIAPPGVFVSGSAVGYYGPRGHEQVTEDDAPGDDFLARVCVRWETEAMAAAVRTRVVCVRTGLVIERDGGALAKMIPPFWLGLGGPVGSGDQFWPWIHRRDWIALVRFALRAGAVTGPVNATSPTPVTNAAFSKALGRALKRPAIVPLPGFALRTLVGEMADALLLTGQRAVPAKAERLGFSFSYRDLPAALAAIFGG
jgi:uncharacterized protein (TIGR01777 family)